MAGISREGKMIERMSTNRLLSWAYVDDDRKYAVPPGLFQPGYESVTRFVGAAPRLTAPEFLLLNEVLTVSLVMTSASHNRWIGISTEKLSSSLHDVVPRLVELGVLEREVGIVDPNSHELDHAVFLSRTLVAAVANHLQSSV